MEARTRDLNPTHRPLGRAARLALIGGAFGLAVVLGIPLCPFAILTRHPCPGCGLTRATLALAHGHVVEAVRLHPLSPVLAPLLVVALAYNALMYVREGRWAASEGLTHRWITRLAVVAVAALFAVWIARFCGAFGGPVAV